MDAFYVVPATTKAQTIAPATTARAAALGCTICTGDPSGQATAWPSVVVLSTAIAPAVLPDTADQVTVAQVTAAKTAATTAEARVASNTSTLNAKAKAAVAANITWLGKVAAATFPLSTAEQQSLVGQVAALTRQVDTLIKLMLEVLTTTTGT